MCWPGETGPTLIVDDGGDATMLIQKGVEAEIEYENSKTLPDPTSTDNEEFKCVLRVLKWTVQNEPRRWRDMAKNIKGVSEETTTGVLRLYELHRDGKLLFPA